jgi:pimeloyl-ACP methyl ester carboxylesterase
MRIFALAKLVCSAVAGLASAGCAGVGPELLPQMDFATVDSGTGPVRLAYRESGQGEPVLLIHGFGANAYTWRRVEPKLASTHRVIAIDLKGFGQSEKPLDKRYSVFDQAQLIEAFMDQKRLSGVTIVGHSLGGGVALVLALQDIESKRGRIKRLALIDSVAYAQKIPVAFTVLRAPVIGPMSNFLIPKEFQARAALTIAYHDDTKFNDQDVAEYAAPLHEKGSQHAMIYSARQIMPENIDDLSSRYPSIDIPALVLWCDRDKVVRSHIGWRLHKDLPRSTFKVIHDCGHIPQEERPDETAEILAAFLNN